MDNESLENRRWRLSLKPLVESLNKSFRNPKLIITINQNQKGENPQMLNSSPKNKKLNNPNQK
ncbi:hypothetical protein Hanom_Chr09g00759821 [Helianthus anomalus]